MARFKYVVDVGSGSAYGEVIIDGDSDKITYDEVMLAIIGDLYYVDYEEVEDEEEE